MWSLAIGSQVASLDDTGASILEFLGSSGGAFSIMAVLILLFYYLKSAGKNQKLVGEILQEQINNHQF